MPHPSYVAMIIQALESNKGKLSRVGIYTYMAANFTDLPKNYKILTRNRLRKMVELGQIQQIKQSFKLISQNKNDKTLKKASYRKNYAAMIIEALTKLNKKTGASLPAIIKQIQTSQPQVSEKMPFYVRLRVKGLVQDGTLTKIRQSYVITRR